jgi:hypothetical protein
MKLILSFTLCHFYRDEQINSCKVLINRTRNSYRIKNYWFGLFSYKNIVDYASKFNKTWKFRKDVNDTEYNIIWKETNYFENSS